MRVTCRTLVAPARSSVSGTNQRVVRPGPTAFVPKSAPFTVTRSVPVPDALVGLMRNTSGIWASPVVLSGNRNVAEPPAASPAGAVHRSASTSVVAAAPDPLNSVVASFSTPTRQRSRRGHAAAARISASVSAFVHTAMLWMLPRNVLDALEVTSVLQATRSLL